MVEAKKGKEMRWWSREKNGAEKGNIRKFNKGIEKDIVLMKILR